MNPSSTPSLLPFGPQPTSGSATPLSGKAAARVESAMLAEFGPLPVGQAFDGLMPLQPVSPEAKAVVAQLLGTLNESATPTETGEPIVLGVDLAEGEAPAALPVRVIDARAKAPSPVISADASSPAHASRPTEDAATAPVEDAPLPDEADEAAADDSAPMDAPDLPVIASALTPVPATVASTPANPAESVTPSVQTADSRLIPSQPPVASESSRPAVDASATPTTAPVSHASTRPVFAADVAVAAKTKPREAEPQPMATPARPTAVTAQPILANPAPAVSATSPVAPEALANPADLSLPSATPLEQAMRASAAATVTESAQLRPTEKSILSTPRSAVAPAVTTPAGVTTAPTTAAPTPTALPLTPGTVDTPPAETPAGLSTAGAGRTADVAGLVDDSPAVALPQQGEGWKKILLNAYKQRVKGEVETVGIKDAKTDGIMPSLLSNSVPQVDSTAAVASANGSLSSIPAEWAEKLAQLTARAERLAPARLEVSLPMQGAPDLKVRVSCRGGRVACEFQNASPELQRLFLREWPGLGQLFNREGTSVRVEQPSFSQLHDGQDRSAAGDQSSGRRQHEERAQREEDATLAAFFAAQRKSPGRAA
ncbi:hypothetical protein [Actomonas aquatica]|uniref:Flagellar hook-length control protein-like C-terminal domain-containing protein n=1 Tax=Actomonas aquatica TaxID=2866162 RepID=A0ABZ1CC77_9BACT|nr:hypothetical protein [Opitutus sp. WL0086]WRQ89277.1 hypothetical protein K1X11_007645 [Opitutus sp. WL0086]